MNLRLALAGLASAVVLSLIGGCDTTQDHPSSTTSSTPSPSSTPSHSSAPTVTPTPSPTPARTVAPAPTRRAVIATTAAPAPRTSCTTTSSGTCIQGGQFCPQAKYGTTGYDANGRAYVCTGDTTHPHWQ